MFRYLQSVFAKAHVEAMRANPPPSGFGAPVSYRKARASEAGWLFVAAMSHLSVWVFTEHIAPLGCAALFGAVLLLALFLIATDWVIEVMNAAADDGGE